MSNLSVNCKPCPECESSQIPILRTIMTDDICIGGELHHVSKEGGKVRCQCCGYEVVGSDIRKAIAKWNELSDKNDKENHVYKWVCACCGKQFDEIPSIEDNIWFHPAKNNEYETFTYMLPCCGYVSDHYTSEEKCIHKFEQCFKRMIFQKDIDDIKEN